MMGIPPSEAKRLTYWEFTAMRHEWNVRHPRPDDVAGEPVDAPSEEFVRAAQLELAELGVSGGGVN
jgi:hypothetical protein